MSRREEEFKHRTSIFEGAYRAWSHLGGLDPKEIFATTSNAASSIHDSDEFHRTTATAKDFDPITYVIPNDARLSSNKKKSKKGSGMDSMTTEEDDDKDSIKVEGENVSKNREYPYEPLPRSGLNHPYIQAVLSPWLGPTADHDAIELGLATLRTWWQHRRKGENKSALKVLGTDKMRQVIDIYTKHFFELAFCLVTSDYVQAPRSLHLKIKKQSSGSSIKNNSLMELYLKGSTGKDNDDDEDSEDKQKLGKVSSNEHLANLSPLERIHFIQKNALDMSKNENDISMNGPKIRIKGKCIPGKIDLMGIMDSVMKYQKFAAANLAHRGGGEIASSLTKLISDGEINTEKNTTDSIAAGQTTMNRNQNEESMQYGDPNSTPILFVTSNNEYLIVMKVDGITCAHCVKIVETVLKGCSGTGKSPISGLLNAAADHGVSSVVISIDQPKNAKRIAYESKRNLSLVGYTAIPVNVQLLLRNNLNHGNDENNSITKQQEQYHRESLQNSVYDFAKAYPCDFFDFSAPCTCPDSGVYRSNCPRHSQMDDRMFHNLLTDHERRVKEFIDSKRQNLLNKHQSMSTLSSMHNFPQEEPIANGHDYEEHDALVVEQPMAFNNNSGAAGGGGGGGGIDSISSTLVGDAEPLPYHNIQQHNNHNMIIGRQLPPTPPPYPMQPMVHVEQGSRPQQYRHDNVIHDTNSQTMSSVHQQQLPAQTFEMNQYQIPPQHQHLYSMVNSSYNHQTNSNNNHNTTSALSVDWEVYELLNEFVLNGDIVHDDDEDDLSLTPLEYPESKMETDTISNSFPIESQYEQQQQVVVPTEHSMLQQQSNQRYYRDQYTNDTF